MSTQGEPLKGGKVYSGSWFQRCQFIMPGRVWWSRGAPITVGRNQRGRKGSGTKYNLQGSTQGMYFFQLGPPLKFPAPPRIAAPAGDQGNIWYTSPQETFHIQNLTVMQAFLYSKEDQTEYLTVKPIVYCHLFEERLRSSEGTCYRGGCYGREEIICCREAAS